MALGGLPLACPDAFCLDHDRISFKSGFTSAFICRAVVGAERNVNGCGVQPMFRAANAVSRFSYPGGSTTGSHDRSRDGVLPIGRVGPTNTNYSSTKI